jgi:hypothetical protein
MAQQLLQNVDARHSVTHNSRGDQYIYYTSGHTTVVDNERSLRQIQPSLSFNEAPTGLLSSHFTGRQGELDFLGNAFETAHGNSPLRCCVHGMHGLGKSQLVLRYAEISYNQHRYCLIFWISGATIEKLNQGFANILNLVGHPDRDHPNQSTRLMAARHWLEQSDSANWLLVLDNVNREAVGFLREHLPRRNPKGNILFTTRTGPVAEALINAAGQHHQNFELRAPDLKDAVDMLLKEVGACHMNSMPTPPSGAEDVVRSLGCLPLAIAHAASFIKQFHKNFDELLDLYKSDHKYQVCPNWAVT